VASVPAGAGVVVNSNSKVEIFDNDIADNKTANLIISAYFSTNYYKPESIELRPLSARHFYLRQPLLGRRGFTDGWTSRP
jgi:hypothetical protein